ncbi:MAG: alpha/beta hydrolase [Rhodoferax sp.]|nr:alpha/beta hydrolase [Rhodoferax sp.]OIP20212.1 MAG: permease [Comamonadaceae bacterium CG2_30_60_41]PIW08232.1 MAG: permease [Comamonadaceae bacterium CG17_big_fil_post_rev_8_21_14_2_50_60_13]PIY24342.1 MAG: permease [Comamonadaceae bacterium CG_4_10_14_3_um_filter_60_75]PJC13991.1 MAG: permease [Comamonadaceae bacterium CG_4_9_14_0_8_um_filter_60_18]
MKNSEPNHHLRATDLRAAALLATQATHAITSMAEGVHQSVWRTLGAPAGASPEQTRGLTGLIYQSIHGVSRLVGQGVVAALTRLEPLLQRLEGQGEESPERAAVVAALNGVMGDRLQASGNPLATPMALRLTGQVLDWRAPPQTSQVTGKVLIVIHGLCMNELQWTSQRAGQSVNHASALSTALGYTPVYVRYNSGLHVSDNGHTLDHQLNQLLAQWPVPVTELSVLAHSMGGLITRSALHAANQTDKAWPRLLKNVVFLGTPHHGSPLERAGNWVDVLLGSTPYTRPLAKLGQLRSAGVTDLRYGLLLDADWQGRDRFQRQPDGRIPVPLPANVNCYAVAATLAGKRSPVADRLTGDGLVPLHSALGEHDDPLRCLHFAPAHQLIVYRTGHLQLLGDPQIATQLQRWLG